MGFPSQHKLQVCTDCWYQVLSRGHSREGREQQPRGAEAKGTFVDPGASRGLSKGLTKRWTPRGPGGVWRDPAQNLAAEKGLASPKACCVEPTPSNTTRCAPEAKLTPQLQP